MAKYTKTIPASTTDTLLTIDIPEPVAKNGKPTASVSADGIVTILPGEPTATVGPPTVTATAIEGPVTTPPVTGTRKNIIQETLADTADLATAVKGWSDEQRIKNGYSLTVVNNALRFELRKTDPAQSLSVRTEITHDIPAEFWFGGRLKLENFTSDTGGESFIQVHSGLNAPPLALLLWGTSVEWTITPNDKLGSTRLKSSTLDKFNNQWVDVVFHVKFAASGGLFQAWFNGALVHDLKNIATSTDAGVYLKLGMNKYSWAPGGGSSSVSKRVFYWDSVRIGNASATFQDVAP